MLKQRLATAAVVFVLLAAFAHYVMGWDPIAESKARGAIDVAVDACSGNGYVFAEKLSDARTAIAHAPADKRLELEAALSNRLKQRGCSE